MSKGSKDAGGAGDAEAFNVEHVKIVKRLHGRRDWCGAYTSFRGFHVSLVKQVQVPLIVR
jgi:hypothetical protein